MTTQFDEFCAQLPFRRGKKEAAKRELIRLYQRAITDSVDVWGELRELLIPEDEITTKLEGSEITSKLRDYLAKNRNTVAAIVSVIFITLLMQDLLSIYYHVVIFLGFLW